jgi:hypothetical protein
MTTNQLNHKDTKAQRRAETPVVFLVSLCLCGESKNLAHFAQDFTDK